MMGSSSTTRADVAAVVMSLLAFAAVSAADTAQCGRNASWALCHNCACCSDAGFCGTTDAYCGHGCQSQCHGGCGHDLASIVSPSLFEHLLLHRNDAICPARGFYTYHALVAATRAFPDFATTGDADTRKREIAAFLAQTSHETTGGWDTAPDGPYTWGYCYKEEVNPVSDYCQQGNTEWPCVPGKSYYGRGPMQISWNYNYGPAGNDTAIAADLLADPDLVARDAEVAFKTALWFWMTPQPPKPSAHDVITGLWIPTQEDYEARREPGFGVITNIVNGGAECGQGKNQYADDRVGFYKRYCDMLGVSYGDNLDCDDQEPFDETTTATAVSLSAAAAATAAI